MVVDWNGETRTGAGEMRSRIVFWQNIPSIHQAALLSEVAVQWRDDVLVVAEDDVSRARIAQGWKRPDFSPAKLLVHPQAAERERLISEVRASDVHIFSGFHAYPKTYQTLKKIARSRATIGVFVEPPRDGKGLGVTIRKALYNIHAVHWRNRINFLLATGELGVRYFTARGFGDRQVLPFGYFVGDETYPSASRQTMCKMTNGMNNPVKITYVGKLNRGKGLDILLKAISSVTSTEWELDVIGTGSHQERLVQLAHSMEISDRVRFLGVLPNPEVRYHIAQADVLVLPSRYDGWGAVVSEALMAGTRVVVSNASGASDLIREPWRGAVFESGSVGSLTEALKMVLGQGRLSDVKRARIRAWAANAIAPSVAARYLIEIIHYAQGKTPKPVAPWRQMRASYPFEST